LKARQGSGDLDRPRGQPLRVVVGVTACNEERTIGPLLHALRDARPGGTPLEKIFVVSSACRDGTDELVRTHAASDPRVVLISEPVRRGKAAAINTYLSQRPPFTDISFVASADILPRAGAVEALVAAFSDPTVGMVGGRPIPQNVGGTLTARMARLMWELHHRAALNDPKLPEMIAFRSHLLDEIDPATPVDEALIELETIAAGFRLKYVPEAVIENFGPATLREWIIQRRRISAGHRWLERRRGYRVSTASPATAARLMLATAGPHPSLWLPALALVAVEATGRLLGWIDSRTGKDHAVWKIVKSTRQGRANSRE